MGIIKLAKREVTNINNSFLFQSTLKECEKYRSPTHKV